MKDRIEFLAQSINDIQGTIRAIDAKFFGIFALLLLPLTELDEISNAFKEIGAVQPTLTLIIFGVLIFSWTIADIICMLGIYSISNPVKRIKSSNSYKGKHLFYRPELFNINFLTQFAPTSITTIQSLDDLTKEVEIGEKEIFTELAFEQIKVSYIRDLKVARQRLAIILLLVTLHIIAGVLITKSLM